MPSFSKSDQRNASAIAQRMLAAPTADLRWAAIQLTLQDLGATAVNAAAVCPELRQPNWFRSSLPRATREEYAKSYIGSDFIVDHVASSRHPLIWQTERRIAYEGIEKYSKFADFVRDAGKQVVLSCSFRPAVSANIHSITYCSTLKSNEVVAPQNLRRIEIAMQLLLPWLGSPEDSAASDLVPLPGHQLSPRELQVLRLIAGGLMTARIADELGISEVTVTKHLSSACRKLDARTRAEAVARALRSARF